MILNNNRPNLQTQKPKIYKLILILKFIKVEGGGIGRVAIWNIYTFFCFLFQLHSEIIVNYYSKSNY